MQHDVEHRMFDPTIASFFDTEIVRSPSKRNKLMKSSATSIRPDNELEKFVEIENCYRMSGITFFPLVDPGKLASNTHHDSTSLVAELLGIRLEVFNETTLKYEPPYYIILKRRPKANQIWDLYKHTIPKVIDIEQIWSTTGHGIISMDKEVYIFAKKCYMELLAIHYRLQFICNLDPQLFENIKVDSYAVMLSFQLTGEEIITVVAQLRDRSIIDCDIDIERHNEWSKIILGPLVDLPDKILILQGSV
ncbi:Mcm21p Ecym_8184 [Eremothecium cymbalariae DBVPG|uniref:Uncharacterized protein n=1 Tax=Eremothecium cymbalariae (strain CBS 270.75 / DBVPG 7215 / KCTC 17166 / NRRL Y-17582) TaxID=931890 RepID=G8JX96_ERECY|nr:Hypothetical protein Ecym_8184 [Eremothecium cymbalariae DBVPG\